MEDRQTYFKRLFRDKFIKKEGWKDLSSEKSEGRKPKGEDGDDEKYIPGRKFKQVQDTSKYPFSCTGLIIGQDHKGELYFGTGFLIGSRVVLTCAHNCYDKKVARELNVLYFCPAVNGPVQEAMVKI